MVCLFSLIICFILVIFSIIYTLLHINRVSFVCAFFYYLIKGIPISFVFIICNISVYYTFSSLSFFFILMIFFIIYTFLNINSESVIWSSLYYFIKCIPLSFVFIICNISVYYTFIFIVYCFLISRDIHHYLHLPPSQQGNCHTGTLLLPYQSYPDYFCVHSL